MNGAHLHLILNHLPIITPVIGLIILCTGSILKQETIKRTALFIFLIGTLATPLTMGTGEMAEDVIQKTKNINKTHIETHIETHEEAAELFALFSYLLGATSLITIGLSYKKHKLNKISTLLVFLITLMTLYLAKNAGTTGGEITHIEIRDPKNP